MGRFEKGRAKTGGRQKGTPNKSTIARRSVVNSLWDEVIGQLPELIEKLDNPKDKVYAILKMTEFVVPKMNSAELNVTTSDNRLDELRKLAETELGNMTEKK